MIPGFLAEQEMVNVILIGMPGSGKSTVGMKLAEMLSYRFVDTDVLIEASLGRTLQDFLDHKGYLALRKVEEEIILSFSCQRHVVATGGSAIYSPAAMTHLKRKGVTVFLDVDLETLKARIDNFHERGIARKPGQGFSDLYEERFPLYVKYADIWIQNANVTLEEVCSRIIHALGGRAGFRLEPIK